MQLAGTFQPWPTECTRAVLLQRRAPDRHLGQAGATFRPEGAVLPYSCVPLGHHSPGTRDSRRQWRDRGEQKGREARQPQCVGHPPGGHREVPSRLHLGKRARGMSWTEGGLTPRPAFQKVHAHKPVPLRAPGTWCPSSGPTAETPFLTGKRRSASQKGCLRGQLIVGSCRGSRETPALYRPPGSRSCCGPSPSHRHAAYLRDEAFKGRGAGEDRHPICVCP